MPKFEGPEGEAGPPQDAEAAPAEKPEERVYTKEEKRLLKDIEETIITPGGIVWDVILEEVADAYTMDGLNKVINRELEDLEQSLAGATDLEAFDLIKTINGTINSLKELKTKKEIEIMDDDD